MTCARKENSDQPWHIHVQSDQIYTVHAMGRLRSNEYLHKQHGLNRHPGLVQVPGQYFLLCDSSNLENCYWLVLHFALSARTAGEFFKTICHPISFLAFFSSKLTIFQLYNLCIKQFGSRSGLTFLFASKLCAKIINRQQLSNSFTMGCPPVRGDNLQALASGLSSVKVDKHGITILMHLHQCRPCTS